MKTKETRSMRFSLTFTPSEMERLMRYFKRSVTWCLAVYCREILLKEPVYAGTVNLTLERQVRELHGLREDLNNARQALEVTLQAAQEVGPATDEWKKACEEAIAHIIDKTQSIKEYIGQTTEKWLAS